MNTSELMRAIRGPVLLIALGLLFVADFFGSYRFSRTFPALLIIFGLMWLLVSGGGSRLVPLDTAGLGEVELAAVRGMLADRGIAADLASGRLLVQAESLAEARQIAANIRRAGDVTGIFANLAEDNDIWRTSSATDKRWQAAKMTALGRLVEQFHSVASATVIYDGGGPRQLSGPAGARPRPSPYR